MLAQETTLREIAGRLTAAGEWDTESIYESLTEAFGNNLSLDKQSKDDTKEEERNINIKQDQLDLLWQLEEFRKKHEHQAEPSDWAIRMCEAFSSRFLLAMMNGFLSGSVALCCCMGSQPAPETNQKSEERSSTNESQTSM